MYFEPTHLVRNHEANAILPFTGIQGKYLVSPEDDAAPQASYVVKGWISHNVASFCSWQVPIYTQNPVSSMPASVSESLAALKLFRDVAMPSEHDRANNAAWREFELLVRANGANGHVPRPYAFGRVVSGNAVYPAILMEYLDARKEDRGALSPIVSLADLFAQAKRDVDSTITPLASWVSKHRYRFEYPDPDTDANKSVLSLSVQATVHIGIELCKAALCTRLSGVSYAGMNPHNCFVRLEESGGRFAEQCDVSFAYIDDLSVAARKPNAALPKVDDDIVFWAPELLSSSDDWQLWSQRTSPSADAWSIAMMLYYLRTGTLPYGEEISTLLSDEGDPSLASYKDCLGKDGILLPQPGLYNEKNNTELFEIIEECTVYNPAERRDVPWMLENLWRLAEHDDSWESYDHYSHDLATSPSPAEVIDFVATMQTVPVPDVDDDEIDQVPDPQHEEASEDGEISKDEKETVPDPEKYKAKVSQTGSVVIIPTPHEKITFEAPIEEAEATPAPAPQPLRNEVGYAIRTDSLSFGRPTTPTSSATFNVDSVIGNFASLQDSANDDATMLFTIAQRSTDAAQKQRLLEESARNGHPDALFEMGLCAYERSQSSASGTVAAVSRGIIDSFLKAAERGVPQALCCLGIILVDQQDYPGAYKLFEKGIQVGCALCTNNLGVMHWNGWGCSQDKETARLLFEKAKAVGSSVANDNLRATTEIREFAKPKSIF